MAIRKLACASLFMLGLSGISSVALAGSDLTIHNNTDNFSTSYINGFACSSALGDAGITKPRSTNVVSGTLLGMACLGHSSACNADVYLTKDCSGPKIATVTLDTSVGIIGVQMSSTEYRITAAGFTISLDKN